MSLCIPRPIIGILALSLALCVALSAACTIVPDEEELSSDEEKLDIYFVTDDFNPDVFVEKIWEDKVVPYFREKCLPIGDVLPTWDKDQEEAGREFGYREKAEGSPWTFLVTGTGKIVAVNTKSRASTVDVDLEPLDGTVDLVIQIGPVLKDTSIRDSLDFISFTDFTNQLEFARLSNAFNKKLNKVVLESLDRDNLDGKSVTFYGAFTQLPGEDLVRITPVILEIK